MHRHYRSHPWIPGAQGWCLNRYWVLLVQLLKVDNVLGNQLQLLQWFRRDSETYWETEARDDCFIPYKKGWWGVLKMRRIRRGGLSRVSPCLGSKLPPSVGAKILRIIDVTLLGSLRVILASYILSRLYPTLSTLQPKSRKDFKDFRHAPRSTGNYQLADGLQ